MLKPLIEQSNNKLHIKSSVKVPTNSILAQITNFTKRDRPTSIWKAFKNLTTPHGLLSTTNIIYSRMYFIPLSHAAPPVFYSHQNEQNTHKYGRRKNKLQLCTLEDDNLRHLQLQPLQARAKAPAKPGGIVVL